MAETHDTYYVTLYGHGRWSGPGLTVIQALRDLDECEDRCGGRAVAVSDTTGEVVPQRVLVDLDVAARPHLDRW